MSRSLPSRPNLDHLRREAKAVLKAHRARDGGVCPVLRNVARLRSLTDAEILSETFSLQEAQHALAREYGFRSWKELRGDVESRRAARSDSVRVRMGALRADAVRIHPSWDGAVKFGWALARPSASVPRGVGRIVEALSGDVSWRIRREAVCALAAYAHLGDRRIESALRTALDDGSHAVRHAAARSLGVRCTGCGDRPELAEYVPD